MHDWCETQAFIEEFVRQIAAVSASPGFTWGKSGNVTASTFLWNDTVPSNKAGRMVPLKDGFVTKIFVASEKIDTFDIQVMKKTGPGTSLANFTALTTTSLVSQRTIVENFSSVEVDEEDELACRVSAGSCKSPVVGIIIVGTNF